MGPPWGAAGSVTVAASNRGLGRVTEVAAETWMTGRGPVGYPQATLSRFETTPMAPLWAVAWMRSWPVWAPV